MRGRGQMLKIYLPVQPRGMAGGTAVGADDRSMGRGPRLSQSCWTVRRRGRVIGKRAAAVRAKRNQFARGYVRLMRLAGPKVGGEVVGMAKRWELR